MVVAVDKRKQKRSNNMSSANQAKGEKDYHSIKVPKYNSRNSREINNIYRCLTAMVEKRHPEKTSRYQEMTLLTFSFLIFVSTSLTLDWKLACAFDHYSTFIVQTCMVDVNKELFFFPYFCRPPCRPSCPPPCWPPCPPPCRPSCPPPCWPPCPPPCRPPCPPPQRFVRAQRPTNQRTDPRCKYKTTKSKTVQHIR